MHYRRCARGTTRTPTLLYNSRFAHPFALLAASLSAGASNATNVSATLTVTGPSGNVVVSQPYANALFTAGSVQRLVLGFDAGTFPTGVYPYTLAVSMTSGGMPISRSATGTLLIVNRKDSPFGTGWWLAGYERLYPQPDSSLLWVGGDGSARLYAKSGTVFRAPGIDRPDSITLQGGTYTRHLRRGARVEFTSDGRHLATHDRLGVVTAFVHNPAGQLVNIDPAGFQSLRYTFAYRHNTGVLEAVTAPAVGSMTRVVSFTNRSDGRVSQIRDPDNTTVGFDYPNSGSFSERILSRTNRRNVVQSFAYDAAGKLVIARVPLSASDTAVTTFCPGESRGFVSTSCSGGPLHPDSAATVVDGPRTEVNDVTTFRLDRFGAPRVIRDALGNSTQLFRGNRTFPALVTRVVHANGWVNDAFHDAKGLLTKLVEYAPLGAGRDAVTEYAWDPKWERVTQITYPERNVVRFAYDAATGNRIWQEDGRGQPSRVDFAYNGQTGPDGLLLASITYAADPQGVRARDTLQYDVLGNLSLQRVAVGTVAERVTRFTNDNVGRQIRIALDVVAGGSQQRRDSTVYDLMDRPIATRAYGFGTAPAETLFTASTYDSEGNLRRLERWSYPDIPGSPIGHVVSRWGFDLANRMVADTAPDGRVETRARDRAGNDTAVTTRRGHTIRMAYDAVDRLTTRRIPGVTYADTLAGIAARDSQPYPRRPNSGTDYAIAADSESFAYDALGRVTSAINHDARVTRDYFANGSLKSERLEVRDARTPAFSHSYLSQYSYDLNGRRTAVRLPPQLVPAGTRDSVAYAYDPVTSELRRVTDALGNDFVYGYTLRGEPASLTYPGSYAQRWSYFADGASDSYVPTVRLKTLDLLTPFPR